MTVKDNLKYYTVCETAKMLGKPSGFFYYKIKKEESMPSKPADKVAYFLRKREFPRVKKINGLLYYSEKDIEALSRILCVQEAKEKELFNTREVGDMIGRKRRTIVDWCKYSDILEQRGEARLIPAPDVTGKYGRMFWTKETIEAIRQFKETIKRGDMAEFNRTIWGKHLEKRKKRQSFPA